MRAREADAGRWEPVETEDGSFTLAHPEHRETCHSTAGAWTQARERYARGCRLSERATEIRANAHDCDGALELRLLEVGTGLGLNLAAACEALDATDVSLRAWSIERDPTVWRATLELCAREGEREPSRIRSEIERWHAPVRAALANALALADAGVRASSHAVRGGTIELVVGEALSAIEALPGDLRFDAIFLDPFSPRVEPGSWSEELISAVAARLAPGGQLSTYTVSMRVRAALAGAGLDVGPGARVGRKASGTIAARGREVEEFDARTSRRIRRRAAGLLRGPPRGGPGFPPGHALHTGSMI